MAKSMYVRITKKGADPEAVLAKHYADALDRQAIQGVDLPWLLGPFKPNVAQDVLNNFTSGGGQGELLDGAIATEGAELVAGGVTGARKKAAKKAGAKAKKAGAKAKKAGAKAKKAGAKAKKAGAKAKKAGGRKPAAKRGKR